MGHTRLGKIPTTRRWRDVVAIFAAAGADTGGPDSSDEVPRLAASTMDAAANALKAGLKDGGIAHVFFILTQLALSTRRPSSDEALRALGINLPSEASHLDLTSEIHRVIDEHFLRIGKKSDLAEMAQLALGETLTAFFRSQPSDLFAPSSAQIQRDLHQLGTQKTFGEISRAFFSGLMSRMLGFYLSKFVLPGEGQRLIGGANDLTRFNAELRAHTYQRAAIIHEFAEKWFSKTEFEKGIDPTNARRFVSYACKKIETEFLRGMDGK
jgi:hypothetical protein